MKKYYFFDTTLGLFVLLELQIPSGLLQRVTSVNRTSTNGTVYDLIVAQFTEGSYTDEAALIAFATANSIKLAVHTAFEKPAYILV